jgi:hypothetical protein
VVSGYYNNLKPPIRKKNMTGTEIKIDDAVFFIKSENIGFALKALKESVVGKRYAWIDCRKIISSNTIFEAMNFSGWAFLENDNGDVISLFFRRKIWGDDEFIFDAISPYIEDGSYIIFDAFYPPSNTNMKFKYLFSCGKLEVSTIIEKPPKNRRFFHRKIKRKSYITMKRMISYLIRVKSFPEA